MKQSLFFRLCEECSDEAIPLLRERLPRSFAKPIFTNPESSTAKDLAESDEKKDIARKRRVTTVNGNYLQ